MAGRELVPIQKIGDGEPTLSQKAMLNLRARTGTGDRLDRDAQAVGRHDGRRDSQPQVAFR